MLKVFLIKDSSVKNSRYFCDKINDKHKHKFQVHHVVWFAM
jgi:hypothetical protein